MLGLNGTFSYSKSLANFLSVNPLSLALSNEPWAKFILFFDFIKVINNNTNEQIDNKKWADNHETNEVRDHNDIVVRLWLHVDASSIDTQEH